MEIRLPEDKLVKLKDKLAYIAKRKKVTVGELLSLIGFLKFACAVVTPGRAYLMRIIDITIGLKKTPHRRRLSKEARSDIKAWYIFADGFNGKGLFLSDTWESLVQLNLFTDASNLGFGDVFGT